MSPSNAIYYKFHSAVPLIDIESQPVSLQLGPEEALARLKELGCTLATQSWVTNHYGLILWKLAGMICLEPKREQDLKTRRWCWPEVIRQLLYRCVGDSAHTPIEVTEHEAQLRAGAQRWVAPSVAANQHRGRPCIISNGPMRVGHLVVTCYGRRARCPGSLPSGARGHRWMVQTTCRCRQAASSCCPSRAGDRGLEDRCVWHEGTFSESENCTPSDERACSCLEIARRPAISWKRTRTQS